MQVLLVYAHPEPRSYNAALRDVAVATLSAAGHDGGRQRSLCAGLQCGGRPGGFYSANRHRVFQPGCRADAREQGRRLCRRCAGRTRQAAGRRPADSPVSTLVVFPSRNTEGLDRPRVRFRRGLRFRAHVGERRVCRQARHALVNRQRAGRRFPARMAATATWSGFCGRFMRAYWRSAAIRFCRRS